MIFLQLMIVTAVALLFSTFSSPILAAAPHVRPLRRRPLQRRPQALRSASSNRSPLVYLARALYYLLPNLAPLDVKAQVVHALPVPAAYLLLNTAYALVYITALLDGVDVHFHAPGFQMMRPGRPCGLRSAITLLMIVAIGVQVVRDRAYPEAAPSTIGCCICDLAPLPPRPRCRTTRVLADVYWIRALQHFGSDRQRPDRPGRFELLYPLLDLTTTLDPDFIVAYRFGAIFLAEPDPGGAGRPDLAIALLEEGRAADDRTSGSTTTTSGSSTTGTCTTTQNAAEWFKRGGDLPGAPWWLRTYAAVMLTSGGDRQASRVRCGSTCCNSRQQ